MATSFDSSLITVTYGDISVVYQPISEANRQSLLLGSYNEKVFMPLVIKEYVEPSDVLFDIGANTGLWTIPLAKRLTSLGRVYAFEPEAESFRAIEKNVELNQLENVLLHKIAISDKDGIADFYVRPGSELHSLFEVNPLSDTKEQYMVQVKTSTIDSLVQNSIVPAPTFVKIDVEGAELLVLEGMKVTAGSSIKYILLELHHDSLLTQGIINPSQTVETILRDLGFRQIKYLDDIHLIASK